MGFADGNNLDFLLVFSVKWKKPLDFTPKYGVYMDPLWHAFCPVGDALYIWKIILMKLPCDVVGTIHW